MTIIKRRKHWDIISKGTSNLREHSSSHFEKNNSKKKKTRIIQVSVVYSINGIAIDNIPRARGEI